MPIQSHDEHFAAQPAEVRRRKEQTQRAVESRVPGATRTARYHMPAFQLEQTFFYTAALRGPKGNLSFPHTEQMPLALIERIAAALATEYNLR